MTLAVFKLLGKTPVLKDKFIMWRNGCIIPGAISLRRAGPMLSRPAALLLFNFAIMLIRPPGTAVPDGLMFYPWCYLLFFRHSFSEVRRPIALKLCRMVGIWCNFITPLQKFGGLSPQKIWGPKTCKISVNFGPLQTLVVNISGTAQDIQNRLTLQTIAIPPAFDEKSTVNFGPLTVWNYMWV